MTRTKKRYLALMFAVMALGATALAQKQRVFVKGHVDSGGFGDPALDETAKHIRDRLRIVNLFTAAATEAEADLLVVVTGRSELHGEKTITVNVSSRNESEWVPGAKMTEVCKCAWTLTSEKVVHAMAKWTKNRKK
jgi:hypothetical protein